MKLDGRETDFVFGLGVEGKISETMTVRSFAHALIAVILAYATAGFGIASCRPASTFYRAVMSMPLGGY